jgi:hypothetical protein
MSLFEDDRYNWRETYFVLFDAKKRPAAKDLAAALQKLDPRYVIRELRPDNKDRFESVTILSPDDYAGMDIVYVSGEEVSEQLAQLADDIGRSTLSSDEIKKLKRLRDCNARFDVFHFEQVVFDDPSGRDDEVMDPGSLLIVLEKLARLCDGISVDPQAGAFL